jgi:hypothetical protein
MCRLEIILYSSDVLEDLKPTVDILNDLEKETFPHYS